LVGGEGYTSPRERRGSWQLRYAFSYCDARTRPRIIEWLVIKNMLLAYFCPFGRPRFARCVQNRLRGFVVEPPYGFRKNTS
jgi:hypothetical protein